MPTININHGVYAGDGEPGHRRELYYWLGDDVSVALFNDRLAALTERLTCIERVPKTLKALAVKKLVADDLYAAALALVVKLDAYNLKGAEIKKTIMKLDNEVARYQRIEP